MLESNPQQTWARSPRPPFGDVDFKEIYSAVGEALSLWEAVEHVMARLFALLVESESEAALQAYGLFGPSVMRTAAITKAAETYNKRNPHPSRHALLLKALKHYELGNARRAEIAHGVASAMVDPQRRTFGIFLVPTPYASKKHQFAAWRNITVATPSDLPFDYAYVAQDVQRFVGMFEGFRRELVHMIREYDEALAQELSEIEFRAPLPLPRPALPSAEA